MAQKQLGQLFRLHGLSLRPDALKLIVQTASSHPQPLELAKQIIEYVRAEQATDRVVDVRRVNAALHALSGASHGRPSAGQVLEVIDAFDMPRVQYDSTHKSYTASAVPRELHASAAAQRDIYANRLALIRQRMLRSEFFKRPALERRYGSAGLTLTDVEALQPGSGAQCVLGLLCEPAEGVYHLEDLTGMVPLDLSAVNPREGLFTLGCIVLADGELTADGVFAVNNLGHPLPEPRDASRAVVDGMRAFGPSISSNSEKTRAALLEAAEGAMLIVLSDVWLDHDDAVATLERVLDGYEALAASAPDSLGADLCFVLCGNFTAEPLACSEFHTMRGYFDQLGELIRARPTLAAHAHFVLVPGPHDLTLGASEALPRSKLPKLFAQGVAERGVAHVHLASNPARLRFFGRDIVLFRDELVLHLRRGALVEPKTDVLADMADHVVKTVIDQAHVRPSVQSDFPVYWSHDHALQLPFTPDVLILADNFAAYECEYQGCRAFNPGTLLPERAWKVYRPGSHTVEFSALE